MKKLIFPTFISMLVCLLLCLSASAGEPLVVKSSDGKFIPAVASEWAKAGQDSVRFVLKSGSKAQDIASQLKPKLSPIQVSATDDMTLVFKHENIDQNELLEKLSQISIEAQTDAEEALAALSGLEDEKAIALKDLSSAAASKGRCWEIRRDSSAPLSGPGKNPK